MTMAVPPMLVATKPLKAEFLDHATIVLNAEEFTVGRSLGNSAVIAFLPLSRKHCIFRSKGDDIWTIEDTSAFGIRLNGKKLEKDIEHQLANNDLLHLDQTGEFIYKFVQNEYDEDSTCPPNKKVKLVEAGSKESEILKNVKQKFEESQTFEVESLEKKIKNAKQLEASSLLLKRQLEEEMELKVRDLNSGFELQIESLRGEKQEVERQKSELEAERDAKMTDMRREMDDKITELQDQISKHAATATELLHENASLRERLEREREEFLARLERESAGRDRLLRQLQDECRQQEETRAREQRLLEESLRRETEQQRIAHEQCQAREEAERKLREAQENTERSLEKLKQEVAEKERELSSTAERRVAEEAQRSSARVSELQEELDKVKTELECEKIVRLFSLATEPCAGPSAAAEAAEAAAAAADAPAAVRSQFGDLLESELQCTVCADLLIAAVTLNCSHTFCKYCIAQWKKKKRDCPICRTFITSECRSLVIDSFIDKMVENLSDEMKQRRMEILRDREELETQTSKEAVDGAAYRGGGGGGGASEADDSGSGSGDESDATSEGGSGEGDSNPDDYSDQYYSDDYQRYYRPEYFDYDSGSDDDASDHESDGASFAGADTIPGGGPGGDTGAVGPGAGAAGVGGGRASRDNTTSRSRPVVAGVPGSYYGGYGRCYSCGARGHWAPGCPLN